MQLFEIKVERIKDKIAIPIVDKKIAATKDPTQRTTSASSSTCLSIIRKVITMYL